MLFMIRSPVGKILLPAVAVGAFLLASLLTGISHRSAIRLAEEHGIDAEFHEGLLFEALARTSFWVSQPVSVLLLPAGVSRRRVPGGEPRYPDEFAQAIADLAEELPGSLRQVGREALDTARGVVSSIQTVDKEIQALTREGDLADVDRIERELTELGEATDGDSDARRQMRRLLAGQLELARTLQRRKEEVTERRSRWENMLRMLWLQMANLRAQSATEALDSAAITGKIRALCEDIARHTAASEETVKMLTPPEGP
jgi:hypothetical protein